MKTPRNLARMDKETARREWGNRFNNRTPSERKPPKIDVRAASDGATEIFLYEEIGFWGVTAKEFVDQLNAISTPSIRVRINSPGGDVFDGLAIHAALKQHPSEITCQVDGIAASAASFIALAGRKCVMSENALMMVHCAWGFALGNKADMRETADILDKIDTQLADIYAKKTGKKPAECLAMMEGEGKNDGTWLTAQEAKEYGLVDEMMPPDEEDEEGEEDSAKAHAAAQRTKILAMKRRLSIATHDD